MENAEHGRFTRIPGRVRRKLVHHLGEFRARRRVRQATRHLSGPKRVSLGPDDVAVICMMRNGAYYIGELLRHHRAIGARHFVFIDNGSDDESLALLAEQPDVTVMENRLPVADYECLIRAHAARRLVRGGWFLFIDTDELAEFPGGADRPVSDYTRYCNDRGYNVVVSQVLDLFSSRPLRETVDLDYGESIRTFTRYSLNQVTTLDYLSPEVPFAYYLASNAVSNPEIGIKFGGIRRELFSEECALTKHLFVRNMPEVRIYSHPHCCSSARCADFNMLIRHYKFAGDFLVRERRQIEAGTWEHGEDKKRLAIISDPAYRLESPHEREFLSADQLVEEGFLACSGEFARRFPLKT